MDTEKTQTSAVSVHVGVDGWPVDVRARETILEAAIQREYIKEGKII